MVWQAIEDPARDQEQDQDRPDDGVELPRMKGVIMHVMPAAEFLLGAVYREESRVYGGYTEEYLAIREDIVVEEIVDDGREEDDRPEVDHAPPEFE